MIKLSNKLLRFLAEQQLEGKSLSKTKAKIIKILYNDEPQTISELMRKLKISYKETHRHIKELSENIRLIQRKRNMEEKHAPVYITLTNFGHEYGNFLVNYSGRF